jgi:hypothetical protein
MFQGREVIELWTHAKAKKKIDYEVQMYSENPNSSFMWSLGRYLYCSLGWCKNK